jgi:hydroxymethylbilane synthase
VLGAVLTRAPASDLLLIHPDAFEEGAPLSLKAGARVGSSSLRRENLLRHHAPRCQPVPLRGNVPTRVEKLRSGQFGAILLAEAGVSRLGLDLGGLVTLQLNPRRWVCAPGQGAVAVQCREGDAEVRALAAHLDHHATHRATSLERDFLKVLEGGCTTPFGCFIDADRAHLGLATASGWRTTRVTLGADTGPAWMQTRLDELTTQPSQEFPDEWLTRRV